MTPLRLGWLCYGLFVVGVLVWPAPAVNTGDGAKPATLRVGFGEADITPPVGKDHKAVFLAGFGHGRLAQSVHDPIMVRAIVLEHANQKIAIVSVDVVGLFLPFVDKVRRELPGMAYVLVSSTHNHEGPDTMGMWGPNAFETGLDADYLKKVEAGILDAVSKADKALRPASARIGKAQAPDLLHDNREPYVKHDELVALQFHDSESSKTLGLVVQWNCHPETLSSKNTAISADFVAGTVAHLRERYRCPVVYLTGTVGGLMTSLNVPVKDDMGKLLSDGTFAKTEKYGRLVGQLAEQALNKSQPVPLTPFAIRKTDVFLPLDNALFFLAWRLGVLDRQAYVWKGEKAPGEPLAGKKFAAKERPCIRSEVGWLRLGDLDVAVIPGEIYPELVLSKIQDPPDPGADFPMAPMEPGIYAQLKGPHRMIVGLGNDEIGYVIPKRQWDEKPPFCYGRNRAQYGEVNSLGPETAPILCRAFQGLVKEK
jgi:Neutral/alkaline non-lysosomal ceramidase, N-terminal